ncbi:hypothetical protein [Azospirillum sp. sgz301742]
MTAIPHHTSPSTDEWMKDADYDGPRPERTLTPEVAFAEGRACLWFWVLLTAMIAAPAGFVLRGLVA